MASKKAGGSNKNNRDSNPKYLGVKKTHLQLVQPGTIIVRQRGTKFTNGINAGMGRDHTIFSKVYGKVDFAKNKVINVQIIENHIQ